MELILYMIQRTAVALLDVLDLAFLVRAVLSWLPIEENAVTEVLYRITEPFILPFRLLLRKLNLFQNIPIDMSFLFTVLAIAVLRTVIASF